MASNLAKAGFTVDVHAEHGQLAEKIHEAAAEINVSAIVMTGKNGPSLEGIVRKRHTGSPSRYPNSDLCLSRTNHGVKYSSILPWIRNAEIETVRA